MGCFRRSGKKKPLILSKALDLGMSGIQNPAIFKEVHTLVARSSPLWQSTYFRAKASTKHGAPNGRGSTRLEGLGWLGPSKVYMVLGTDDLILRDTLGGAPTKTVATSQTVNYATSLLSYQS